MALKPLRPCRKPGCTNLTRDGWCEEHRPKARRGADSAEWHRWYGLPMAEVQELFAVEGLRVEDRVLHPDAITGEYNYDYAEIAVPLHYFDDRPGGREWPIMKEVNTNIKEG